MSRAFYLHGNAPDPPPEKEPFIVVQGKFNLRLYDINSLPDLPLTNLRKIWKIMFSAAWENEQTIEQVRIWLPRAAVRIAEDIQAAQDALKDAKATAAKKHSEKAIMGDGYWEKAVAAHKRALKSAKAKKAPAPVVEEITHQLEKAVAHRDAPKLADRAVKDAQTRLAGCKAKQDKIKKLQAIFNDMAAQAKL